MLILITVRGKGIIITVLHYIAASSSNSGIITNYQGPYIYMKLYKVYATLKTNWKANIRKGFSTVELIIVVVLVGILTAAGAATFSVVTEGGNQQSAKLLLSSVKLELANITTEKGSFKNFITPCGESFVSKLGDIPIGGINSIVNGDTASEETGVISVALKNSSCDSIVESGEDEFVVAVMASNNDCLVLLYGPTFEGWGKASGESGPKCKANNTAIDRTISGTVLDPQPFILDNS